MRNSSEMKIAVHAITTAAVHSELSRPYAMERMPLVRSIDTRIRWSLPANSLHRECCRRSIGNCYERSCRQYLVPLLVERSVQRRYPKVLHRCELEGGQEMKIGAQPASRSVTGCCFHGIVDLKLCQQFTPEKKAECSNATDNDRRPWIVGNGSASYGHHSSENRVQRRQEHASFQMTCWFLNR